jgi:hypothetical protein
VASAYRIAPIFLIRIPGVPFDAIDQLATSGIATLARSLRAARNARRQAKAAVERLCRSGAVSSTGETFKQAWQAIRAGQPLTPADAELPSIFEEYAANDRLVSQLEGELAQAFELDMSAARSALWRESRKFLTRYLVFGAAGIRDLLSSRLLEHDEEAAVSSRNKFDKKIEQTLVLYLQRIATKNDTFSEFGPSSWGTTIPERNEVRLNPRSEMAARDVFLERWTAHGVVAAINADPAVQAELKGAPLKVPALEPHAFETLMADVEAWADGPVRSHWLSVLRPLAELPARFAGQTDSAQRAILVDEARLRLAELGATTAAGQRFLYVATNPIGEECVRHSDFEIGEELFADVTRDAAPWIDFWRDSYAFIASRVAAGLRQVFEKAAAGQDSLPLPVFLAASAAAGLPLTGPGLVALAAIAFQEVKAAFRARLQPHADDEAYELTVEDCHVVRNSFQYPPFDEYTYPSADLQIAARSVEAIAAGQYQWVVSELHPPVAMLHHGTYWACPDKAGLGEALARSACHQPNFHFGLFAADLNAHTTVRIFDALPKLSYFVSPQRGNPNWATLSPDTTEVYVDKETGDVRLRRAGSREYLGSFARAWIIPLGFHPFQFGLAPHTPRLLCGRVVVQRQTWTVRADEMPQGSYKGVSLDLVMAIDHLRVLKNWPRYIYIRPTEQALRRSGGEGRDKDTKPVFIDLESYLFLETFHRWLVKAGELEVTEMLPAPDQLFWHEADGRRTFELRTLIVPAE